LGLLIKKIVKYLLIILIILTVAYEISIQIKAIKGKRHDKVARVYYQNAYFREAAKEFENARASKYAPPDSTYLLANSYFYSSRPSSAKKPFNEAINKNQNNLSAYYQFALTLFMQKEYEEAISVLKKAIYIDNDFVPAYILLGDIYEYVDIDESLRNFEIVLTLNNNKYANQYADNMINYLQNVKSLKKLKKYHLQSSNTDQITSLVQREAEIIPYIDNKKAGSGGWLLKDAKISFFSTDSFKPIYYKQSNQNSFKTFAFPVDASNKIVFGYETALLFLSKLDIRIDPTPPVVARNTLPLPPPSREGIEGRVLSVIATDKVSGIDETEIERKLIVFKLPLMKRAGGTVFYSKDSGQLSFKAYEKLKKGRYIAYLKDIADKAGNKIKRNKTWLVVVK